MFVIVVKEDVFFCVILLLLLRSISKGVFGVYLNGYL